MLNTGGTVEPRNVRHSGYSEAKKCWKQGVQWSQEMSDTGGTEEPRNV